MYMYILCFCVSIFFKIGSLYSYCDNNQASVQMYPPELFRIAELCTNSNFFFGGGEGPPDPAPLFKQSCFRLYYNQDTANHLKKLNPLFSGKLKIKWLFHYVLFEKSIVDHFFREWMFKRTKKSP